MTDDVNVKFGASTENLIDGVKNIENQLTGLFQRTNELKEAFAGIAEAVAAGFAWEQIQSFVEHVTDLGVQIERTSQQLGISTEMVGELNAAAKFSDTSLENMRNSMARFDLNMQQASKGTGTAAAAFNTLGINVRDSSGNIKDAQALVGEISEKFNQTADNGNKTAIAMALFGRQGKDLIPILDQGASGMQHMNDIARETSTLFDQHLVDAMHNTHDKIVELDLAEQGLKNTLFLEIKPAFDLVEQTLIDFVESLTKSIKESDDLRFAIDDLIVVMKAFETGVIIMAKGLETTFMTVQAGLGALNQYIRGNKSEGDAIWREYTQDIIKMWDGVDDKIKSVWRDTTSGAAESKTIKPSIKPLGDAEAAITAATKAAEEAKKLHEKHMHEVEQLYTKGFQGIAHAGEGMFANLVTGSMSWRDSWHKALIDIAGTFEQFVVQAIDTQIKRMVTAWITSEGAKTTATVAGNTARTASDASAATVSSGFTFAKFFAEIEADAARTYAGVFGFLSPALGPFAAVPAGAAAALVAGMSALVPSFAVGSYNVPGDMMANIHRGEMIIPAAQAQAIRSGAGAGHTFIINAVDSQSFISLMKNNGRVLADVMQQQVRNMSPATRKI